MGKRFDKNGLRYSLGQLDTALRKVRRGELRNIKSLSDYVDGIYYFSITNPDHPESHFKNITESITNLSIENYDANQCNMTVIGNTSYIIMHHPSINVREKALQLLAAIFFTYDHQQFCQSIKV